MTSGLNKAYGNIVFLANLLGQRRIPYLAEEKLRAIRDHRLRKIVHYAAQTVPYYRNLFKNEGIDPRQIRTAGDLRLLPLIDKQMLREEPDSFVSQSRTGRSSVPFATSGSTGMPVRIYRDSHCLIVNRAFDERSRAVIGQICGRKMGYSEVLFILRDGSISQSLANFGQRTFIPIRSARRVIIPPSGPFADIIRQVNLIGPDVMRGYGSFLESLFRAAVESGLEMHRPRLVVYSGDAMTVGGKKLIEDEMGIPVHSHYRAVEGNNIGFYCEHRTGFHLNDDLCHVRIVDHSGNVVPDGESGEVVISNLINRGTVLLNYRLGDVASMSRERCACGRNLPLLGRLEGRSQNVVYLSNGNTLSQIVLLEGLKWHREIRQFQLIQHDINRFELKLVTQGRETFDQLVHGVLSELRELLGADAFVDAAYCERLERDVSGKFNAVISHYRPDSSVQ